MENRAYALAAGLFTLLLGFGIVAAALWFSGEAVETEDYLLVSRQPVTGLNTQAPVRYRGLAVGKVVSIELDPQEPRNILVQISIKAGTPLTKGSFARLGSQGVTGLSYVMLDDEGSNPELLPTGGEQLARLEVRPSFMDSITVSGQEMVENFNRVAKRVDLLLNDENQKQLVSTLRNLDQASGKVVALANEIEPTLKKLPAVANDASVVLKRADSLLANLNDRVDAFERAAKSAEQLGRSGVALSDALATESLPRLNVLLDDLQRTSRGLERLLTEVNDQPQSLIFGKSPLPPGPGEPGFGEKRGAR
jgi:phospholipid/cholesterol/gamma-HCH transport system substrate-binding protein